MKQYDQIMKDAPKPGDYPEMNLVVSPKIEFVGKKINLSDLLAEYGINKQPQSDETTNATLPNNKEDSISFKHN